MTLHWIPIIMMAAYNILCSARPRTQTIIASSVKVNTQLNLNSLHRLRLLKVTSKKCLSSLLVCGKEEQLQGKPALFTVPTCGSGAKQQKGFLIIDD